MPKKKAKEPKSKLADLWLTRDLRLNRGAREGGYNVYIENKPKPENLKEVGKSGEMIWYGEDFFVCEYEFSRFAEKKMHLKPGGGPIRVKLVRV